MTKRKKRVEKINPDTIWFLCRCWYCRIIHHPVQGFLKWLDYSWVEIHEKKFQNYKERKAGS